MSRRSSEVNARAKADSLLIHRISNSQTNNPRVGSNVCEVRLRPRVREEALWNGVKAGSSLRYCHQLIRCT